LSDLSDEFTQTLDRFKPDQARTYEASFQRMRPVGITAIDNTVVFCRTYGEAKLRFESLANRARGRGYLREIRAGSLGEDYANFTRSDSSDGAEASAHIIVFRRDLFVVTLTSVGLTGTFTSFTPFP